MAYCVKCGNTLTFKELKNEGMIPFCTKCNEYRYETFNVAVSMVILNKDKDKYVNINELIKPTIHGIILFKQTVFIISGKDNIKDPKVIGISIKNINWDVSSEDTPIFFAIIYVLPLLDIPGISASP